MVTFLFHSFHILLVSSPFLEIYLNYLFVANSPILSFCYTKVIFFLGGGG